MSGPRSARTIIGFLVLLFGRSVMVRQMALASLGGTAGFLLFLAAYRHVLRGVRFRALEWPKVTVSPRWIAAGCGACTLGIAVLGVPRVGTRVEDFRFQTPVARPAGGALHDGARRALARARRGGAGGRRAHRRPRRTRVPRLADATRHPLASWRPTSAQEESLRVLRVEYPRACARVQALLESAGIRLDPAAAAASDLRPLGEWEYLDRIGTIGPIRWADEAAGGRFLLVGLRSGAVAPAGAGAVPMSPRHHYDALLTGLSRELGVLFLAGLLAMAVYLVFLQRRAARVLYVFAPLFLCALAFAAYARITGGTLNIVHFMGFSLVIALALDYTAVAVSSEHRARELSKVLLTGASTLATFGVLVVARHPVMRDLGTTVAIGSGMSLLFALFVRLPAGDEADA